MEDNGLISIKLSEENDFLEIIRLYRQLWEDWKYKEEEEPEIRKIYLKDIETKRKDYYIATRDNKIFGVCSLLFKEDLRDGNIASIEELVVDKDIRGKGIGKKLLDYITTIAKDKNCYSLELHSNIRRVDAHRFYEKNGFDKKSYYFEKVLL